MNKNIEVINENLLAVNIQYLNEGYIKEMKLISAMDETEQIYLSNTGKIILDSSTRAYPALKKLFLMCMRKSTDELLEIIKKPKKDSLDGLCENVIGWELKRRCVMTEYVENTQTTVLKDRLLFNWWTRLRKRVKSGGIYPDWD